MNQRPVSTSPPWGPTTKLVVALTVAAIVIWLFIQFHGIIGPLMMAFVVAYLLNPVAGLLHKGLHLSWALAVGVLYILILILILGGLTLGGLGLVGQIQSLVSVVQANLASLPRFVDQLSGQVYQFGPLRIDFSRLDMTQLSAQLLGVIQPLLGSTGTFLTSVASGAASFLGWALFVWIVSYFVVLQGGEVRSRMLQFDIPGYAEDIRRMGTALGRIWNAFLRGQIIIFILAILAYTVIFSIVGIRYSLGIALIAGLCRFLPYIGPFITWGTLALVAYFQPNSFLGIGPIGYAILCVVLAILIDQSFDNVVAPRIIAGALKVHPAAVLVAAIIAANLLGILGVIVAAPILATVALFWRYMLRKMLDLDPWPEGEVVPPPPPGSQLLDRIRQLVRGRRPRPG